MHFALNCIFLNTVKKIGTFAILLYYVLGTILFPLGDLSYAREIPDMYRQCALEDPDLNALDFIFEHLANISDDHDSDSHEKPHQPNYQHTPVQAFALFTTKIGIPATSTILIISIERDYPISGKVSLAASHLSQVFRPPIA